MEVGDSLSAVPPEESTNWVTSAHRARVARYMLDGLLDPESDSELAAVDAQYPWEKCSAWIRSYLLAGCEHLLLWANVIAPQDFPEGAKVTNYSRPYYALARSGLESACQAVWILTPDTSNERTTRHLRLVYHDLRHMALSLEAEADPRSTIARERMSFLQQRIDGRFDFVSIKNGEPKFLNLVRECASAVNLQPDEIEAIWRLASGAAHGKNWFQALSGQFVVDEEYEPEYFRATHFPDPVGVTKVMDAASRMTVFGVLRFAACAGLDYKSAYDAAFSKLLAETPMKDSSGD
jgi:hypothetical protein